MSHLVLAGTLAACQLSVDLNHYRFADAGDGAFADTRPLQPAQCDAGPCARRRLVGSLAFEPPPPTAPRGRVIDQSFDHLPPRCAPLGAEAVCLQGGFQP